MGAKGGIQAVAAGNPARIVIREPGDAGFVLPDQNLHRQIDADGLIGLNERRAEGGGAEDQQVGGPQEQAGPFG